MIKDMRLSLKRPKVQPRTLLILGIILLVYVLWALLRPVPAVIAYDQQTISVPRSTYEIEWPEGAIAAFTIDGSSSIAVSPNATPGPTASTIKAFLVSCILDKKPLKDGEEGPTITLTQQDVDRYDYHYSQGGSVVPVEVGLKLTQRQALEALLLRSANNLADSLAIWAFGSIDAYLAYANQKAASLAMNDTHIADPSGLDPATVSSPRDMILVAKQFRTHAALRSIASQEEATLPLTGTIYSTNDLLGVDGIDGIKTGTTPEGGHNLLFSATMKIEGIPKPLSIVGIVMRADSEQELYDTVRSIVTEAAPASFETVTAVKAGTPLVRYETAWGQSTAVTAASDVNLTRWKPDVITGTVSGSVVPSDGGFSQTASVKVSSGIASATGTTNFSQTVSPPSLWWKLTHPIR